MKNTDTAMHEIEAIQLQFMEQWEAGENPTLESYVRQYPHFAPQLTEFVLLFLEGEAAAARVTEREVEELVAAMDFERVRAGALAPARTLREARTALGWTPGQFAEEVSQQVRLPDWAVLQFERGLVRDWSRKVANAFARALSRTQGEIALLLQGSRPAAASGHYSSKGTPSASPQTVRTFTELLDECVRRGEMTDAERRYWLEDEEE